MSIEERARQAAKIIANPSAYKICEVCESILKVRVNVCPACNAYRFETDSGRVIAHAKVLGQHIQTSVLLEDLE